MDNDEITLKQIEEAGNLLYSVMEAYPEIGISKWHSAMTSILIKCLKESGMPRLETEQALDVLKECSLRYWDRLGEDGADK